MRVNLMLTVQCDRCQTHYVPDHVAFNPSVQDPDSGHQQICWVRFVPNCPACNAIVTVLRRANLGSLAGEI